MAKVLTLEVQGLEGLKSRVSGALHNLNQAVGAELYQEGQKLMTEAKFETPVDTGALRSSGHVELPVEKADGILVQVGFGGPAAPYAVHVHEDLQASHKTGKAKYLADPFNRRLKGLVERISAGVKARLGR